MLEMPQEIRCCTLSPLRDFVALVARVSNLDVQSTLSFPGDLKQ